MVVSLSGLVGQIANHLSGGLRGQQNYTYSLQQLADEVVQVRGDLLRTGDTKGRPFPLKSYAQVCPTVQLRPRDWVAQTDVAEALLANLPVPAGRAAWFYARIPRLLDLGGVSSSVLYFGPAGRPEKWTVIDNPNQLAYDQFRRLPRRTPLVYVEGNDLWVTSRDGRHPALCKLIAGFADPRQPAQLGLSQEYHPVLIGPDDDLTDPDQQPSPFPIPEDVAERIVQRVLQRFYPTHGTRPVPLTDGNAAV